MTTSLYRRVLQDRQDLFNQALRDGVYIPFIYPWDTIPVLFLIVGVLFSPRLPNPADRLSRVLLTFGSFWYLIAKWPYTRTVGLTAGYGIGLTGFWGMIMTVVLMILHDPGKDFSRIEIRKFRQPTRNTSGDTNGSSVVSENGVIRKRTVPTKKESGKAEERLMGNSNEGDKETFVWQDQPRDFWHLVDWSADLMTSFRGINWNFRIPIKTYVVLPPDGDSPRLPYGAEGPNPVALQRLRYSSVRNFIFYYIVIDLLKTFMMTDPYWLGIATLESPTPWLWLARLNELLPVATRFVRLSVSLTATVTALTFIFSLNPLFFAIILPYLLGDKLYSITKSPLLEVWMYPPQWGNMFSNLCNKGLAGMWSTWWHQMFRYGISEPSRILIKKLNVNPRGQLGRVIQLSVAFGLTAGIHAAASSTTFSIIPGRPLQPFIFFVSQAAGILTQTELSRRLNKLADFPKIVRQVGNFVFAFIFLWYVGPYLSDDFARCQIWLFEPVPISIFRGLGYGPGDCWMPWLQFSEGGKWLGWWDGGHWYNSGLALF